MYIIIIESRTKNKERTINDNFEKLNSKKKAILIENKGINAKILLIIVFFAVNTFKP